MSATTIAKVQFEKTTSLPALPKAQPTLQVRFWGVRGSHPVPGADTVRFGGNTPCVEVRAIAENGAELLVILDAGTGIVGLGRELMKQARQSGKPVQAALFFSHLHHDHTQGFPFFTPAFSPSTRLQLFAPGTFEQSLEDVLRQVMRPPVFPVTLQEMGASKTFTNLYETSVVWLSLRTGKATVYEANALPGAPDPDTLQVRMLRSYAHPGGVAIYRIDWRGASVVYATDTEGYVDTDRRLASFARGADLLIHDAQYAEEHYCGQMNGRPTTQGWGHSTARMACAVAQAAGVGELALFHHDPGYDDETIAASEATARSLFASTNAAREGQEVRLVAQPLPQVASKRQPASGETQRRAIRQPLAHLTGRL